MPEFTLWNHDLAWLQWAVVVAAALIGAMTDLRSRRIPNMLTLPLVPAGMAWAIAIGGLPGLGESMLACLLLAFPFVILFLFAGGGAGDAKMMGAIGAWVGLAGGTAVLLTVTAAGIVLAVVHMLSQRRTRAVFANLAGIATGVLFVVMRHGQLEDVPRVQPTESMETVPYGVAIFAGTAAAALGVLLWHA